MQSEALNEDERLEDVVAELIDTGPALHQDLEGDEAAEIATETLYGDLVRCVLDEVKALPDVWQKLPERKQAEVIDRVVRRMNKAASFAILAARAGDHQHVPGVVEQVVFKDGIKCVLKITPGADGRHELADREGRHVVVLLMEPEDYGAGAPAPEPEPDQRGLELAAAQEQQAQDPDRNPGLE